MPHNKRYEAKEQWVNHAGLYHKMPPVVVIDGDHSFFEIDEGRMRDERKQAKSLGVPLYIPRMMVTFSDKKAHDRGGKPTDSVQHLSQKRGCGHIRPGYMIDKHGSDSHKFEIACGNDIATFKHFRSCRRCNVFPSGFIG